MDLADVEWLVRNRKDVLTRLNGDERHLSIRAFLPKMARTAYERQKGVCPICGKHFAIEDMQADHIVPWSKGGRTTADNCQMLCKADNLRKSAT